jgi:hypothetical protein
LKILEAMALGRAVVSTPVGCEGLAVEHGRELLIAKRGPAEFAEAILRLLADPTLASGLAARAPHLRRAKPPIGEFLGARLVALYPKHPMINGEWDPAYMPVAEILVHPEPDGWRIYFSEIRESFKLILLLTRRNIKIRYQQTAVGALWAILQPLMTMAVFTGPVRQAHECPDRRSSLSGFRPLCISAVELLRACVDDYDAEPSGST